MFCNIELSLESFGPERIVVDSGTNSGSDMIRNAPIAINTPITRADQQRVILSQGIALGDYPLKMKVSAITI